MNNNTSSQTPFPVLISIPHGGTRIPDQLAHAVAASDRDLFMDSDAFTIDIYSLGPQVMAEVWTDIYRAFIDLNRAPRQLPPQWPDGVIKSVTCYGKPVYRQGIEPWTTDTLSLLSQYYYPYHRRMGQLLKTPGLRLALDCHSMAAQAPLIAPDHDTSRPRPMICLGNAGGRSCPPRLLARLARCFTAAFQLPADQVSINYPFSGGYITRTYGKRHLPWVQVEMNRALYLTEPWFNPRTLQIDPERSAQLKNQFKRALQLFFDKKGDNNE